MRMRGALNGSTYWMIVKNAHTLECGKKLCATRA